MKNKASITFSVALVCMATPWNMLTNFGEKIKISQWINDKEKTTTLKGKGWNNIVGKTQQGMLRKMKMNEENNKKTMARMTITMTCIRKMTKKDGKMLETQNNKDNNKHQEGWWRTSRSSMRAP